MMFVLAMSPPPCPLSGQGSRGLHLLFTVVCSGLGDRLVVGSLHDVGHAHQLCLGELAGGTRTQLEGSDVRVGVKILGSGSGLAHDAYREDGEVVYLDRLPSEDKLMYAGNHVGYHSPHSTLGVGGAVLGHVCHKLAGGDDVALGDTGIPASLELGIGAGVLIQFVLQHNDLFLLV